VFYKKLNGKGKCGFLFIHGAGGDGRQFNYQMKYFEDSRISVAVDLPGHGFSPLRKPVSLQVYAEVLLTVLDKLGIYECIPVGHSMGGGIAFEMFRRMPGAINGIVFISTAAALPVSPALSDLMAKDFDSFCDLAVKLSFSESVNEATRKLAREQLMDAGQELVSEDFKICGNFDYTDDRKNLDLPVLVIANSNDKMVPLELSRSLAEACPSAQLEVIDNDGHMPHIESHERVNSLLEDFMEKVPPKKF